jgi:probable F420-dependent oxidoreductase
MHVSMTVPTDDLGTVRELYAELEAVGYDRAFSFEAKHDPFLPLAVAAEHTTSLELGTAVAIAFARTPMTLANIGWDMQALTGGRFVMGLGSQIAPHIRERFSMPWSRPVERMGELVRSIRSIWDAWEHGTQLDLHGEFYTHTRMIPAFDPGPNPYGSPHILMAGFGPRMTRLAGQVGDGFLVHPVNTRRSLLELTVPAIEAGLAESGRSRDGFELVCVTIVVTGDDDQQMERSRQAVREQLAFYGTTPAYLPVFELHARGELHPRLKQLARDGRWPEMAGLIDDEFLETVAVVGAPGDVGAMVRERLAGVSDRVSLVNNRCPDPRHFARAVADLHGQ